jgi:hypothetical protein
MAAKCPNHTDRKQQITRGKMDDSQARGLTKRFIREYIENQQQITKALSNDRSKRKKNSHKDLVNFAAKHEYFFPSAMLIGGRRQNMLFISMLAGGNYNPSQDFEELNLYNTTFYSVPKYCSVGFNSNSRFAISLHCIQRIFQRNYRGNYNFEKACKTIISQCRWIGNWTAIWGLLNLQIFKTMNIKINKVVIPAKDGLFFAILADDTAIDIRTFVDDELLTEEQRSLKDTLTRIAAPLEMVPLHFALEPQDSLIRDDLLPPSINAWLAIMQGYRRDFFYQALVDYGPVEAMKADETFKSLGGANETLRELLKNHWGFKGYYLEYHKQSLAKGLASMDLA